MKAPNRWCPYCLRYVRVKAGRLDGVLSFHRHYLDRLLPRDRCANSNRLVVHAEVRPSCGPPRTS